MTKMRSDWGTIKIQEVRSLPALEGTYKLSDHLGSHCFLDAPGFPTYFIQNVYNLRGDNHSKYDESIAGHALPTLDTFINDAMGLLKTWFPERDWKFYHTFSWDMSMILRDRYYKTLWSPLPYEHPRVRAWENYLYSYFRSCWMKPDYPVEPFFEERELLRAKGYNITKRSHVAEQDCGIELPWEQQAERSPAYRMVKEFYPEATYQGTAAELKTYGRGGSWWERLAMKPTPEECPGEDWKAHPVNGNWCQKCGWHAEVKEQA